MSITEGEKIFAAPHATSSELLNAYVERIGPVAFLWHTREHSPVRSRLTLLADEGVEWCRDDQESRDALAAARKLFLSMEAP